MVKWGGIADQQSKLRRSLQNKPTVNFNPLLFLLLLYFVFHISLAKAAWSEYSGKEINAQGESFQAELQSEFATFAEGSQRSGVVTSNNNSWQIIPGFLLVVTVLMSALLGTWLRLCGTRTKLKSSQNIIEGLSQKLEQRSRTLKTQEQLLTRLRHHNEELVDGQTALFEVVSHEIKNPLTAIKSNFLSWFRHASFDEVMLDRARLVENSIQRLELFCQQAGALTGKQNNYETGSENGGWVSLSLLVNNATKQLSESLQPSGICIESTISKEFKICGDGNKLNWMLSNLLQSAVKRASKGDLLKVDLSEGDHNLVLTITESGLQQNNHYYNYHQNRQHENSYQSKLQKVQSQQGLELFFAGKIAQQHNAIFSTKTDATNGIVNKVIFQQYRADTKVLVDDCAELACVHFGPQQQPVLDMPGPSADSPRCLILDNDADSQRSFAHILSKYFNVKGVFEQSHALEQVKLFQPDVVISETRFADGDGFDMLRQIKQHSDVQDLPIIIVTTQDNVESRLKALELDILSFFNKPYSEDVLCKTALKLSGISRAQQQLETIKKNVPFQQSRDTIFLNQLNSLIENHIDDVDFQFENYFDGFSLSKRQFFRRVNALTRCTPKQYLIKKRLELARHLLGKGVMLDKVTRKCGFRNNKSLMKLYEAHFSEKVV